MSTAYRSLHIFSEKLVVYVYHLEGYSSYQESLNDIQMQCADQQVASSSYFTSMNEQAVVTPKRNILKNIVINKAKLRKRKKENKITTGKQNADSHVITKEGDINSVTDGEGFVHNHITDLEIQNQLDTALKECTEEKLVDACEKNDKPCNSEDSLSMLPTKVPWHSCQPSGSHQLDSLLKGKDVKESHKRQRFMRSGRNKPRKIKQNKKMKLLDKVLDDFHDTQTSDDDVDGDEPVSGHLSNLMTQDKGDQMNGPLPSLKDEVSRLEQNRIPSSPPAKVIKNKYKFKCLRLNNAKPPSLCEGDSVIGNDRSFTKSTTVESEENAEKQNSCLDKDSAETGLASSTRCTSCDGELSSRKTSDCMKNIVDPDLEHCCLKTTDQHDDILISSKTWSEQMHTLNQYLNDIVSNKILKSPDHLMEKLGLDDCPAHSDPSVPIIVHESNDNQTMEEIKQIRQISKLSDDHLYYLMKENQHYLKDILKAKVSSRRHDDYKSGIKQRANLSWQIPLGLFTDTQVDVILHILQTLFCKKHTKYLDYVLKVLFPEALIKIYMDIFNVDHATAEDDMNNAVYQSDSQSGLNITDSSM